MARIEGVDLPRDKRVEIALTYIYGIGRTRSNKILEAAGVDPDTRVKDLKTPRLRDCAKTSTRITRLRAICAGRFRCTSNG